jgi:DNA-binding SARP family transcriptional activator/tetratricopeptide (TPR) repeat protein
MEFRILGPLEVVDEGRTVTLGRKRVRALLGFFLLHANELVTSDRLIDQLWGPQPPKTASASLQNHISRLRKVVGPDAVLSQPGGYVLRVDPERFDLARFERLAAESQGAEPRERADKLRAALSLWRGPALEDLAFESFVQDEVRRLEDARLAALEERIDADLELGREDLVGELGELVDRHPLRERFRAQLMRALYRAGRQGDALAEFQETRKVLMDELGLEPSEELRVLQHAILQQDPSLGPTAAGTRERTPDRRTVTVLFCDLVASTELAKRLDPEAYRVLMERYLAAVRVPIERHGGTVEKFIGDAVMAVFGVPELHEDDALRAVRAAADAREVLHELDELAAAEWEVRLAGRIGVNTGEVHVIAGAGQDLRLTGAAVNVASQLEERAPPGEILIGDETFRLVRDAVRAARFEAEEFTAWRLEDVVAGAPAYARRLDAPLVGRAAELGRLRSAYEGARDENRCRIVTVTGEAGIGKTRLIRELVASVGEEARVLVGRCVSYGEGASYLPIAEIVRQATPEMSLPAITELIGGEDAELVAQRVAELTGVLEGAAASGEAFWAVRRFVEAIAREQPLLLAFDDIHWAEPTLLDLIEYLGKWADGPILVVCAARPDLREARPAWGGPTSTGFVVELGPLPPDDVSALVTQLASEHFDAGVEKRVVQHSGGNPLFAEQLLALAAEQPELALDDPPPTVDALLASRFDRLDPRELAVLRRASVIGHRFSWDELVGVTPPDDRTRTKQHLAALMERGFVHPAEELFRFHHVLVRDVAYRGLPKAERSGLHELAARALERRDGADEIVGYHFEQAYRYAAELARVDEHARGLATAGGERLGQAGVRAWRLSELEAALNLLARATELLPPGHPAKSEWQCELGLAFRMRGDIDEAERILEEASSSAAEERIKLRVELELQHARSLRDPELVGDVLAIAERAIPAFEAAGDDRALGRAWLLVGVIKSNYRCENAAGAEACVKAARHYARAGWSPSTSLGTLGAALFCGPTPVSDALGLCTQLLADHGGDRASEANILVWMGSLEAMRGQFGVAREAVGRAKSIYMDLGLTVAAVDTCGLVLGVVEMLAGKPEAAEVVLREGCTICAELQQFAPLSNRASELADALYAQGSYGEAEQWAAVGREHAAEGDLSAQAAWRSISAKISARTGVRDADKLARAAVDMTASTDALNERARSLADLAEVLRLGGRQDDAQASLEEAIGLYKQKGNTAAVALLRASTRATAPA